MYKSVEKLRLIVLSGVLKAIHCGQPSHGNRITKDTVIFNASDFPALVEKLQLDLHEPPMSQVNSRHYAEVTLLICKCHYCFTVSHVAG